MVATTFVSFKVPTTFFSSSSTTAFSYKTESQPVDMEQMTDSGENMGRFLSSRFVASYDSR